MIIGVIGKMGSGKDTLAKMIQEIQPEYDWKIKKFSGKLKQVASIITGIDEEKFEDQNFKTKQMGSDWGTMTYREFLQILGTNAMRDVVHKNVWVNALMSDYKVTEHRVSENLIINRYPNWIISDIRFINEAETVRLIGYPLVKILRGAQGGGHVSERELDSYHRHHYEIDNNGNLDNLRDQVKSLLSRVSPTINKVDH
jgi:hypothetical protein